MGRRTPVLVAVAVLAVIVVLLLVFRPEAEGDEGPEETMSTDTTSATSAPPSTRPGAPAPSAGGPTATALAPAAPDAPATGPTGPSGPAPGQDAPEDISATSEVAPQESASPEDLLPGLEPPVTSTGPWVHEPLPTAGSAQGTLVTGFPTQLIRIPEASAVETSAVTAERGTLQATLVAAVPLRFPQLLRHFRSVLLPLGFIEEWTPSPAGTHATAFRHGDDVVVVTVAAADSASRYTVLATLHVS